MKKKSTQSDLKKEKKDEKKVKNIKAESTMREIRWDKLDNTAHLFPVIAGESMSNVYRISITLTEIIQPEQLQQALDIVLPKFDGLISDSGKVYFGIILRKMESLRQRSEWRQHFHADIYILIETTVICFGSRIISIVSILRYSMC